MSNRVKDFLDSAKVRAQDRLCIVKSGEFQKRSFDLVVGHVGKFLTTPIVYYCARRLQKEFPDETPFFYQERQGLYGKPFVIKKLRTMHGENNEISKFGAFLRATGIDEFPNFENVIAGDMSIVGWRPRQLNATETIPHCYQTLTTKPAITGPFQLLSGFTGETCEIIKRKLETEYATEKFSYLTDLSYIFKTLALVAKGKTDRSSIVDKNLQDIEQPEESLPIIDIPPPTSVSFFSSATSNPNIPEGATRKAQAGFIDFSLPNNENNQPKQP